MSRGTEGILNRRTANRSRVLRRRAIDALFSNTSMLVALFMILLIGWIGIRLFLESGPTRERFGFGILTNADWDINHGIYGAATFIFGTLVSSLVALLIAVPISIGA